MTKLSQTILRPMLHNTANIFLSRISGLFRDIMAAAYWGAVEIPQAAYNTAFAIPNMLRSLFAEGAFSAAFVPLVTKKLKAGDTTSAWNLACRTITLQATLLLGVIALVSAVSAVVLACLPTSPQPTLTCRIFQLLPLLIPYAFFICIAGAFAAILNALQHFAIPSATPILFNLVQVAAVALLYLCGKTRQEFSSLILFCVSTLIAGLLQMAVLMYFCHKKGFDFHLDFHWKDDDVHGFMKKFIPSVIGSCANLLNMFIDKGLAAYLGAAAVGAINYSNRLIFLPVGIFGVAMNTVCLTKMSRASQDELADCLDTALRQVLALALPCTAMLAALDTDVIRLLFMRGAFNEDAVRECAWALAFYLPGLPAFCATKVATTTHHGRCDTKTPMRISLFCIGSNCILNLILIQFLRQGGLALASSVTAWMNVLMLLAIDTRKIPDWHWLRTLCAALKIAIASAIGGIIAYATARCLTPRLADIQTTEAEAIIIFAAGFLGMAAYVVCCLLLRQSEIWDIITAFLHRKK